MNRNFFLIIIIICSVISCKKDKDLNSNLNPVDTAGFQALFRIEYNADSPDVVYCHNLSRNFKTLNWVFSDSTFSKETNPIHIFNSNTSLIRSIQLIAEDETGRLDTFKIGFRIQKGNPDMYYNAHLALINLNPVTFSIYRDDGYFGANVNYITYVNGSKIDTIPYSKAMQVVLNNRTTNNFRLHTIQNHESSYLTKYINIPIPNIDSLLQNISKIPNPINYYDRYIELIDLNGLKTLVNYNDTSLLINELTGNYISIKDTALNHEFKGNVCFLKEKTQNSMPNIIRFMTPGSAQTGSSSKYIKFVDFNFITKEILAKEYFENHSESSNLIYKGK